jgi:hypothetical protein
VAEVRYSTHEYTGVRGSMQLAGWEEETGVGVKPGKVGKGGMLGSGGSGG